MVSNETSVKIRSAYLKDAPVLVSIMIDEIYWGLLRDLGRPFLTLLHRHMIRSKYSLCYVAEEDGMVIGYITGTTDISKYYREFLLRYGLIAIVMLLPKIFNPVYMRTIIRGLTYFPEAFPEDPKAEMLSFAVRSEFQGSGVGKQLLSAIFNEFKSSGTTAIKFGTVEVTNEAANKFYRRIGCDLIRTIPFYKDSQVNVYVYHIK